jgi:hypothetical protein
MSWIIYYSREWKGVWAEILLDSELDVNVLRDYKVISVAFYYS